MKSDGLMPVCILFSCAMCNLMYYTELESDSLSEFLAYRGHHGSINKIKDNWYCSVRESDVTR